MADCLARNLEALAARDPQTAALLRDSAPPSSEALAWSDAPAASPGMPSAAIVETTGGAARRITLASRFNPADEAARFAATADLEKHAAVVVMGFGLGYHVRALLERCADKAIVIVYEPDAAVLRGVMERLDLRELLVHPSLVLLVGELDEGALVARLERFAALITQGVQMLSHAPTRQRHGPALKIFSEQIARLVAFLRTNIATTLVNAAVTCRNLTQNLGHYAAGATVNELRDAAKGRPAVLVSAGPSLAKNIHLLSRPGMRDRVMIIAVQTVLKPLLQRGIRPHFVTALDYHEISARFYENLPPLPDVTLVAEPKAHCSVLDCYPGPIRVLQNGFLDRLLGPLARPIAPMRAGSTVAHLSLYLAWHLGCDPVIMIGQDLGFSDGLYYCPGTAIHDVWAPELNAFNTLEMMEWKRIARHKNHLRRRTDVHGRSIYTDEQMLTYLAQFERDFAASPVPIIDATEGGLPKAHTTQMTLAEALEKYAACATPPLAASHPAPHELDQHRLALVIDHLARRSEQVTELRQVTVQTLALLDRMLQDQRDPRKIERHFEELARLKARAAALSESFVLVNELNQIGVLKRLRADRVLRVQDLSDAFEKQARQIERDQDNLRWMIEGCDESLSIFEQAAERLRAQRVDEQTNDIAMAMAMAMGGAA